MRKQTQMYVCILLLIPVSILGVASVALGQGEAIQTEEQTNTILLAVTWHGFRSTWDDYDREESLNLLAETGVRFVRFPINWGYIEKEKSVYDEERMHFITTTVELMVEKGLTPTPVVLGPTPDWAAAPNPGCLPGQPAPPNNPQDFGEFMAWLVPKIPQAPAWEVWNEPNLVDFLCTGDPDPHSAPEAYAQMLQAAYTAIKSFNADLLVVFAGLSGVDAEWLECAYASDSGIQGFFDVMAVHPYSQGLPPNIPDEPSQPPFDDCHDSSRYIPRHITAVRQLMQQKGDGDKPMWATEFGWSTHPNYWWTPGWARGVTLQEQAEYIIMLLNMMQAEYPYVTVGTIHTTRDECIQGIPQEWYHPGNTGLLYSNLTPKPAYDALVAWSTGAYRDSGYRNVSLVSDTIGTTGPGPLTLKSPLASCQPCIARTLVEGIQDVPGQTGLIALLHQVRDEKLARTPFGKQVIRQYYVHSPELVRLVLTDPSLRADMLSLLRTSNPMLASWVEGNGKTRVSGEWIRQADQLVQAVADRASPELRDSLLAIWSAVDLAQYEGWTIEAIWTAINQ